MEIEFRKETEIIVFTGPESSGKTTCADRISKEYQLPLVQEYARAYLSIYGSKYTFQDIQNIAEKQIELERDANQDNLLVVCDTDLLTLEIWALEKFGLSLEIKDELLVKKHYLLCYPDIPWEVDPMRENPEDRLRLFKRHEEYLAKSDVPYSVLKDEDRNNLQLILSLVRQFFL